MIEAVVGSTVERVDQARRKMASAGHEVEEDNVSEAAVPSFQKLASGGKLLDPARALRLEGAGLEKAAVDSTLVQGFQKQASAEVEAHNSEVPLMENAVAEMEVHNSELPLMENAVAEVAVHNSELPLTKNAVAAEGVGGNRNLEPLQQQYAGLAVPVVCDLHHSDIVDSRAHRHRSGTHPAADLLVEEAGFHVVGSL